MLGDLARNQRLKFFDAPPRGRHEAVPECRGSPLLLIAQRRCGVEAAGSRGWYVPGRGGHHGEAAGGEQERPGIVCRQTVELTLYYAGEAERGGNAHGDSYGHQEHHVAHDHPDDVGLGGTEAIRIPISRVRCTTL